jgi:uncharacterized membrane protein
METRKRLVSIDAMRGLVMIIMALDHVRDFFSRDAALFSPTDLARTTPALFLTRWITHFCAPVFMFTAGIGAYLWWQRGHTRPQLSVFLLTRGLWLVILEVTVMRPAYNFNFSTRYAFLLVVLWALGMAMIGLAALIWLPTRWLAVVSIATIALHNCLDGVQATGIWNVLHRPGLIRVAGQVVIVSYPLVPWITVMAAGFCLGPVFRMDQTARRRLLIRMGTAVTLAFVLVRTLNVYGDPARWSAQKSAVYTVFSFLNCTKYPPSLDFLLMTLGPALLALAYFDRLPLKDTNPLIVFGRVPLFYFIAHFYLAHVAAALLAWLRYGRAALPFLFQPVTPMGGPQQMLAAGFGYDLWVTYLVWALIVAGLYFPCRWFARVKAARRDWWLSYL